MPDTPENQAVYPQMKAQKPGCGFPIARILVVFSLSVGTVLEAAIGKYKGKQTGENSLFRELYDALAEGDVMLADRYFSGWCDIALPLATRHRRGHPQASTRGERTFATASDWAKKIIWLSGLDRNGRNGCRPSSTPPCPTKLTLREVRIRVAQKGFRTKSLVVVTTLFDAQQYPAEDIASVVPPSLAGGASLAKYQDRSANGPFAVQDARPGSQRILHASARLQSASRRDGGGGLRVRQIAVGNQFQGDAANAQSVSSSALGPGGDRDAGARRC